MVLAPLSNVIEDKNIKLLKEILKKSDLLRIAMETTFKNLGTKIEKEEAEKKEEKEEKKEKEEKEDLNFLYNDCC
jgi:ribosomal protein L12E/L44/L45/RPP1/RPP2